MLELVSVSELYNLESDDKKKVNRISWWQELLFLICLQEWERKLERVGERNTHCTKAITPHIFSFIFRLNRKRIKVILFYGKSFEKYRKYKTYINSIVWKKKNLQKNWMCICIHVWVWVCVRAFVYPCTSTWSINHGAVKLEQAYLGLYT